MEIIESIDTLTVQDPGGEDFCSSDLEWFKLRNAERCEDVALIPYDRVDAFIIGECSRVEFPTRFHVERGRKRARGSLKQHTADEYLDYKLYWCSFGPENYGEGGTILPSRRYRLNTRNRAARPQSMRGCTCHFIVKRLYARPSLALLIYSERRHVNKSGIICHGPLDGDAIGPGAKRVPYMCSGIQQQTMSMMYLGIPEENVLEKHIEGIHRYCDPNAKVDGIASQYVHKVGMIIKRSSHELDLDDEASIRLWVERNKKSVFFHRDASVADPLILGIQTEWQLQQMIRFGHRNIIALHSTFGIKRFKYPLCTVVVFDSRNHALPVAWVISRSVAKQDVTTWMKALLDRVHLTDPGWTAGSFIIDDAALEVEPIRQNEMESFSCPILFSLWRIRRSWLKHIVEKCSNIEVQREMFKRLGEIVYCVWNGRDVSAAVEEFLLDFADQASFMEYFKDSWVPKIEMWLMAMKNLPLASQETSAAVEAYHIKLETKLSDDDAAASHLGSLQRVDWLVHKLITELHSGYWLDRYADETDSFRDVKDEYIRSTSWHRALQIPDSCVLPDSDLSVRVTSQKEDDGGGPAKSHVVWNPGSEFSHCTCESSSTKGNLCEHVLKVGMVSDEDLPMSFRSLKAILIDAWRKMKPADGSMDLDVANAMTWRVLDRVRMFGDLYRHGDVSRVVDGMVPKWIGKKAR
ncbi:hypothetical protein M569_12851, partial [Genlisea aurea]